MADEELVLLPPGDGAYQGLSAQMIWSIPGDQNAQSIPGYFIGLPNVQPWIRDYTDAVENLYLIGRNSMHRCNNQDHSITDRHGGSG